MEQTWKTIVKFLIQLNSEPQKVQMPVGAEVLSVDIVSGDAYLYALVTPVTEEGGESKATPQETRTVRVCFLGLPWIDEGVFVGKLQNHKGDVLHVFIK